MTDDDGRPGAATRAALVGGLTLNGIVCGITAAALLRERGGLPTWFIPRFLASIAALEAALAWYVVACWQGRLAKPAALDRVATATLVLVVATFVCTSSLHNFYPFRPSLAQRLEGVPLGLLPLKPMARFNFALTAAGLIAAAALATAYIVGFRRAAVVGMVALAIVMLIPNDDCANAFNRPWIRAMGASPLMFAPASVALLVAACGLSRLWRRTSLAIVATICLATLALGLGHMSRVIW